MDEHGDLTAGRLEKPLRLKGLRRHGTPNVPE
jgi:hypothetical protein